MTPTADELAARARAVALRLHANPEVGLAEFQSSSACQDALRDFGFTVTAGVAELPTAFVAERALGSGTGPRVGLSLEFDALPGVGHGCGHNLIAGATVEAAGLISQHDDLDGRLVVLGTPAEEMFAGKPRMLQAGLYAGIDAVVGYHPSDADNLLAASNGVCVVRVTFTGRSAHAATSPHLGRSAGDGAELLAHALAMERQYHPDGSRIHVLTERVDGAHNVLAAEAAVLVDVRSATVAGLAELERRVAVAAAATAQACELTATVEPVQRALPFRLHPGLADIAWEEMGLAPGTIRTITGSTDLGDVSQAVPTVCIGRAGWAPVAWHSPALHEAAGSEGALRSMHRAAGDLARISARIFREKGK